MDPYKVELSYTVFEAYVLLQCCFRNSLTQLSLYESCLLGYMIYILQFVVFELIYMFDHLLLRSF